MDLRNPGIRIAPAIRIDMQWGNCPTSNGSTLLISITITFHLFLTNSIVNKMFHYLYTAIIISCKENI